MSYGGFYQIGAASLDGTDLDVVHIVGALLLSDDNAIAEDSFEYAGRRISIAEVIDDESVRLKYDWPDSPFEDVAGGTWVIRKDSPLRNPSIALARQQRDTLDRLRIFNFSKPLFGVKEYGVNTPPEDYATDDMCVIGSSPSGVFAGNINKVARFTTEASWFIQSPEYGWHIISEVDPNGTDLVRSWNGTEWVLSSGLAAGIVPRGIWSNAATYTNGNVVKYNQKLWLALQQSLNQAPTEGAYWTALPAPAENGGVPLGVFEFLTNIEANDPTPGKVKLSHATQTSANVIRVNKIDAYSGNYATLIAAINASTTSNQKGKVRLQVLGAAKQFVATVMAVTLVSDSFFEMTISSPAIPYGALANGDLVILYFQERGDVGLTGLTGPGYKATSATSLTVGATTPISFTTQAGLAYVLGSRYRLNKSDDPEVYVEGFCTSYDIATGAFTGTVDRYKGSGSVNSWNLNLIGLPGVGYRATSGTSLSVSTGTKNLTTQPDLAYAAGARARLSAVGNAAWMEGPVTSYNSTTGALVIDVDKINNSGTFASWAINLAGEPGIGINGADGASALTRIRVVDIAGLNPTTAYEAGDVVDGKTLVANNLVLRAKTGGDALNGVYVVPASGAASRHSGFAQYNDHPASEFNVMEGDTYAGTKWRCTSPLGGTLNTTAITLVQSVSMQGSENLSELTDLNEARDNMGLGDLATMNQSELVDPVAMAIVFGS